MRVIFKRPNRATRDDAASAYANSSLPPRLSNRITAIALFRPALMILKSLDKLHLVLMRWFARSFEDLLGFTEHSERRNAASRERGRAQNAVSHLDSHEKLI